MSPHFTPTCSFSARWAMRASSSGGTAGPDGPERAHAETISRAADDESPEPMGSVVTIRPSKPWSGCPASRSAHAVPAT